VLLDDELADELRCAVPPERRRQHVVGTLDYRLRKNMADSADGRHKEELDGPRTVDAEVQQVSDTTNVRLERGQVPVEVDRPLVVCVA